jgi:hypothetical protein
VIAVICVAGFARHASRGKEGVKQNIVKLVFGSRSFFESAVLNAERLHFGLLSSLRA